MAKHTPGPWGCEATPASSHWDWKVTLPRGQYIGIDTNNAEADARLIAAAPELLEALREMLLQHGVRGGNGASAKARAAIAKATEE